MFTIISLYIVLDVITVFLLLLFSIFLFSLKKDNIFQVRMLAVFFMALALSYMDGVFISFGYYFHANYPYIVHICMSFDYLVGPALYIFALSRTQPNFIAKPSYLWHGLPFVLHFTYLATRLTDFSLANLSVQTTFSWLEVLTLSVASSMHLLIYGVLVVLLLINFNTEIKNNYSDLKKHSLSWLMLVTCGLLLAGIMRLMNNIWWLTAPESAYSSIIDLKVFAVVGVFLFASTVIFRSMRQPAFLNYEAVPVKYKSALLDESAKRVMLNKITTYMTDQVPYLEASFDLATLAQGVGIPSHQVSQVLNTLQNQSFFDFVNSYRIKESLRLLADKAAVSKNITQVMYEVGFNSKSVFNTSFKKITGLTPSEYRKSAAANC